MRKFTAVLGIVVTLALAFIGFSGYSSGSYSMVFWGIELSRAGFLALILAFVAYDIFAIKGAFGKDKVVEKMSVASQEKAREAEKLEGAPCTVSLTRFSGAMGAAMGVRVFLNGVEQETLRNGRTVLMQTELARNELAVSYNADNTTRSITFDAKPGGNVRITLKYVGAVLTIQEDADKPTSAADAKGRYRPVRKGYVVWSILNMPIYLLGLVPLTKTIRAAKQPYEDVAQHQMRSARAWNIALSCAMGVVVLMVLIVRLSV